MNTLIEITLGFLLIGTSAISILCIIGALIYVATTDNYEDEAWFTIAKIAVPLMAVTLIVIILMGMHHLMPKLSTIQLF